MLNQRNKRCIPQQMPSQEKKATLPRLKSEWNNYLTTFCIKTETVFSYISIHNYLKSGAKILHVGIYLEDTFFFMDIYMLPHHVSETVITSKSRIPLKCHKSTKSAICILSVKQLQIACKCI
jgi:hypothetical protein